MLITLYKYRKGSGPSATTRKYMCFISNASAPSVLEYTFRWMYVLSRTISLYIIFWMEIVTYHLLCSPISGNWWSLSSLSTSLSSIFKKGWVLIFIMCWGSGGPSDVLNEGPNKRNKTQPHFSRQCETSRQWRLPVRLLLFRLHRSIQICIHQLPTFLSFSCRLSSFDCWLLFLLSSMNIPFIETWLLTDPIQCFSSLHVEEIQKSYGVENLDIMFLWLLSHMKSSNLFLLSREDWTRSNIVVGNFYLLVFIELSL